MKRSALPGLLIVLTSFLTSDALNAADPKPPEKLSPNSNPLLAESNLPGRD